MSPMNNRRMTPTQEPGVLDFAPGAAAAYSLRNLSLSYAGPVVTVRRSTDNAEADFTAAEVSDGTLAGWAGADGFVKQWWDQSGNARHATQATTTAQPQIVDSGVLVTEGGKAAVRFDGVDDNLKTAEFLIPASTVAVFAVFKNPDSSAANKYPYIFDGAVLGYRIALYKNSPAAYPTADSYTVYSTAAFGAAVLFVVPQQQATGNLTILSVQAVSGSAVVYEAGVASGSGSTATDGFKLLTIGGRYSLSNFLDGTISELLIYPTDQTALRTRIEGNMAFYY